MGLRRLRPCRNPRRPSVRRAPSLRIRGQSPPRTPFPLPPHHLPRRTRHLRHRRGLPLPPQHFPRHFCPLTAPSSAILPPPPSLPFAPSPTTGSSEPTPSAPASAGNGMRQSHRKTPDSRFPFPREESCFSPRSNYCLSRCHAPVSHPWGASRSTLTAKNLHPSAAPLATPVTSVHSSSVISFLPHTR